MHDFEKTILIGVIFDISSTNFTYNQKNIDYIKEVLVKTILDQKVNSKIYVSHPDWNTVPKNQGDSTFFVISYKEPKVFSIEKMFKDTVSIIGECKEECDKHILIITDRFKSKFNFQYKKGFLANNIRDYNTKIHVFGFGDDYDKEPLATMVESYGFKFYHLNELNEFNEKVKTINEQ